MRKRRSMLGGSGSSLEILAIDTGERSIIHTSVGRIYGVAWSPDGSTIAFTDAPGGEDDDADIFLIDLATRDVKRLTDDPGWDHMPVWRPDGRAILFTSYRTGKERIYSLDPMTHHVTRLWAGDDD